MGDDQLSADSRIIAVSRAPLAHDDFLGSVLRCIEDSLPDKRIDESLWARFAARITYVDLDIFDYTTWDPLVHTLQSNQQKIRAIYLATAPEMYGPAARGLQQLNLISEHMRIVLEKPVGRDYQSACEINDAVGACFSRKPNFPY